MTLDHTKATAIVRMDGLGVCCFNRQTQQWQVVFLRQPQHDLQLSVSTKSDVVLPQQPITGHSNIRIYADRAVKPDYENTFREGFFDNGSLNRKAAPTTPAEEENFRWVVDLENEQELPLGVVSLKRPASSGILTVISDAVFYNNEVTPSAPNDFFLLPDGIDANRLTQTELEQFEFGKVNDLIAADIICEDGGSVVIEIDGKVVSSLVAKPGLTYLIALNNMRMHHMPHNVHSPLFEKIDFSLYYDVIDVTKSKLAMWGIPPNFHSGRVSCNIVRTSLTDDLSLLAS